LAGEEGRVAARGGEGEAAPIRVMLRTRLRAKANKAVFFMCGS
jgi:hypothetical protein